MNKHLGYCGVMEKRVMKKKEKNGMMMMNEYGSLTDLLGNKGTQFSLPYTKARYHFGRNLILCHLSEWQQLEWIRGYVVFKHQQMSHNFIYYSIDNHWICTTKYSIYKAHTRLTHVKHTNCGIVDGYQMVVYFAFGKWIIFFSREGRVHAV